MFLVEETALGLPLEQAADRLRHVIASGREAVSVVQMLGQVVGEPGTEAELDVRLGDRLAAMCADHVGVDVLAAGRVVQRDGPQDQMGAVRWAWPRRPGMISELTWSGADHQRGGQPRRMTSGTRGR